MNQTYNPCDECRYSYSRNNQESRMCKICEFAYFRDLVSKQEKGEWLPKEVMIRTITAKNYTCSICDYESGTTPFCANCGARMKGNN